MNSTRNKKICARLLLSVFVSAVFFVVAHSPVRALAQEFIPDDSAFTLPPIPEIPNIFAITLTPPVPEAGEIITAKIVGSFTIDSATDLSWFINNAIVTVASGTPPGTLAFRAPSKGGEKILVKAVIIINGERVEQSTETQTPVVGKKDSEQILQQLRNKFQEATLQQKQQEEQIYGKRKKNQIISITADNKNPGPYETVNLLIESGTLDIDRVFIEWSINGKKTKEGTGEKDLSIQTEGIGSQKTVRARVTDSTGTTYSDEIIISPFEINLYWWANSFIPHWYKGKALPSTGSSVRVSAFIPTGTAQSKNFVYRWLLNNEPQQKESGMNRQTFSFRPFLESFADSVTLRLESSDKTISAEIPIAISTVRPEIFFCVVDMLSGCVKGARETTIKGQNDLEMLAIPFFFWKDDIRLIKYQWTLGGRAVSSSKQNLRPWILSLKNIPPTLRGKVEITADAKSIVSKKSAFGSFIINLQ